MSDLKNQNAPRILIAASGTGGHLFPALFIAQAIHELSPKSQVHFLGSGKPLEKTVIDVAGFQRHEIPMVGVKRRGLRGFLEFLRVLPGAWSQVSALFSNFRPQVVIGVGGYASVLPVIYAKLRGIPSWIHEAELKPGLANFVLSFCATRISVAFERASIPCKAKVVYTGHPLRKELKELAAEMHNPDLPQKILVFGGSQGAHALDAAMQELAPFFKSKGVKLSHQCREENVKNLKAVYQQAGLEAQVQSFVKDVPSAYRWCDIVVSRSGAGAVMEIGVVNKPAILVPYPFAQGGHQKANAEVLLGLGKALLVEEGEQFAERLKTAIEKLLDPIFYRNMREKPADRRSTEAALTIARACLDLITSSESSLSQITSANMPR